MRKIVTLLGAVLFFSLSAAAQGAFGVGGGGGSPVHPSSSYPHAWEMSVGYQYNRINLLGTPFNMNAFNASITRYVGNWFGVEGQFGGGIGNTGTSTNPANLDAKSIFVGGGPRFAARRHGPIVPWVHALGGLEHLQFTPAAGMLDSNSSMALQAGGGVDVHMNGLITMRTEADAIVTRFFSANQRHFQIVTGLVFGF